MKNLTLIIVVLLAACTSTRIVTPSPTHVPSSLTKDEVELAIFLSLKDAPIPSKQSAGMQMANRILDYALGEGFSRGQYWFYEGRGNSSIYAGLHNRQHYLRAEIKYTKEEVTFHIVDSRNLNMTKDRIHKKALVWLSGLERNVRRYLGVADRAKYEQEIR